MVDVVVRNAVKQFGGPRGFRALSEVSLTAADGEFLVLLGPSGSGKTTLLRAIAGLETLDAGDIFIGTRRVNDVDPGQRNIGMVFQDYALYPHLTVRENIGYNMKLRRIGRQEMSRRVAEVAAMLGLDGLLDRRPAQLSGGQRQRVALGRAITRDGSVLLMDEPLSNLDAQIREHVRVELRELQRRIGVTTIHVTHDQVEAMVVADRLAVMSNGKVEQIGRPDAIYDTPETLFCARFVGSPRANELRGTLTRSGERFATFTIAARDGAQPCSISIETGPLALAAGNPADVIVVFRPEDIQPHDAGSPGLPCSLLFVENRGAEKYAVVELPPALRHAQLSADLRFKVDRGLIEGTALSFVPRRVHIFDEKSGARIASGEGKVIERAAAQRPPRAVATDAGD